MRTVFMASPLAGDVEGNLEYARRCLRDCLIRDEAPYAPHCLYAAGVLRDDVLEERRLGLLAGQEFLPRVDALVVYCDRGVSRGMAEEINIAARMGLTIEYRSLRCS